MQVVHGGQHGAEHFAAAVEVVQVRTAKAAAGCAIGARVARTGVAGARAVERAVVCLVACVAQLQVAIAGEDGSVARIACGHDAVKHVYAVSHALHQVFGRAHAHQVARFVFGQTVWRVRHDFAHLVFGLAHAHATNGVAREVHVHQVRRVTLGAGW